MTRSDLARMEAIRRGQARIGGGSEKFWMRVGEVKGEKRVKVGGVR